MSVVLSAGLEDGPGLSQCAQAASSRGGREGQVWSKDAVGTRYVYMCKTRYLNIEDEVASN